MARNPCVGVTVPSGEGTRIYQLLFNAVYCGRLAMTRGAIKVKLVSDPVANFALLGRSSVMLMA